MRRREGLTCGLELRSSFSFPEASGPDPLASVAGSGVLGGGLVLLCLSAAAVALS
jgi:hypothetical protein